MTGTGQRVSNIGDISEVNYTLGFMESELTWIAAAIVGLVVYILSSGAAFVSIYRSPNSAPTRFYGWLFAPLDWLARRAAYFGVEYNACHQCCYRHSVW